MSKFTVVECCAGGGGQALGLEAAGFVNEAAIEIDTHCCTTLRLNRPQWNVLQEDMRLFNGVRWKGVDLFAAGVPCPPFSIAGKQLGTDDDRDLFQEAIRLVREILPRAVILENVPGFASAKFKDYRKLLFRNLEKLGYQADWRVLQSADFGVPQLRPRFVLVALREREMGYFSWPEKQSKLVTIGSTLKDLMALEGWKGANNWAKNAQRIGPTIVGGSKKHGGPDLGPTRARKQWLELGIDGLGIADAAPSIDFPIDGCPRLTVRMVARVQGFPDFWKFSGKKTASYRQVGNAFPPPVAAAVGSAVARALEFKYPKSSDVTAIQLRLLENQVEYC